MVERVIDPSGRDCHWVIRPNQSLSWHGALWIYAVITTCLLGIGIVFAIHGYWPVLPFAGLEVLVLGAAFWLCHARSQIREVVTLSDERLMVEKGRTKPEQRWECPRAWARVIMERAPHAWYPSRLSVAFQGRRVEIGRFLNEMDRQSLALELQGAIREDCWRQH
ncbi:MAG: DUF2244 domain-containing protein [Pseudomonadota bacterium]